MATHAHTIPNPSRRILFGAATALALARPTWAADPSPDAELLAFSAAFDALEHRCNALYEGPTRIINDDERDIALAPIRDEQERLLTPLMDLRAQTLAGARARLQTLLLWDKDLAPEDDAAAEGDYVNHRLLAALLRDLDAVLPAGWSA